MRRLEWQTDRWFVTLSVQPYFAAGLLMFDNGEGLFVLPGLELHWMRTDCDMLVFEAGEAGPRPNGFRIR